MSRAGPKTADPVDKHVGGRVRMRRMMEPGEARRRAWPHVPAGPEIREGHQPDQRQQATAERRYSAGPGYVLLRGRTGCCTPGEGFGPVAGLCHRLPCYT